MKHILLALLVVSLFTGCLKSREPVCNYNQCAFVAPEAQSLAVKTYLDSVGNTTAIKHCSGMYYEVITPGTGNAPTACSAVQVNYKLMLTNGTLVEQTSEPAAFYMDRVIAGFTNGLLNIKEGGKVRLYIPPFLGYGSAPQNSIPANSILIFETELLQVR
ncbi:MAG TPA: FKBP-type peptidyl-prolyl cis-trans isomerase [Chitinophagaceae bacterium]|jgi:FKBP-type peptidyl-prolyl cis-trans isomerase FkpA|nr:FKBP-type peptidyl-prolyl cis-trans isomerase [Chitinophagaceae bacterium]